MAGDDNEASAIREARILALVPLAQQVARRARHVDDALSICYYTAVRCVDTWRPAHGATLDVYARRAMHNALLNAARSQQRYARRIVPLDEETI